jgi:hypothetical protein
MSPSASTQFYLTLNTAASEVIERATADPTHVGHAQHRIDQLNQWREALISRPDSVVLQHAISEATVGLFLLVSGLYRPAFVSLRLFLELSLASIHFSANRLELAEWLTGNRDVNWSALIDVDQGILSVRYADAFFPELRDSVRTYNVIGLKVYRELSEYVHGNHHTWGNAPGGITHNADLQARWLSSFEFAATVVLYSLSLRFVKELPKSELTALAPLVLDSLGHIEALRQYVVDRPE